MFSTSARLIDYLILLHVKSNKKDEKDDLDKLDDNGQVGIGHKREFGSIIMIISNGSRPAPSRRNVKTKESKTKSFILLLFLFLFLLYFQHAIYRYNQDNRYNRYNMPPIIFHWYKPLPSKTPHNFPRTKLFIPPKKKKKKKNMSRPRRRSSGLGAEPRGDTGAPALSTLEPTPTFNSPPLTPVCTQPIMSSP